MKVCFFSPTAYSYFNPEMDKWAGGAETQQFLIARHMIDRGVEVSFIVGDHGQPDVEVFDGIRVIKSFRPFAGNRKLRFASDMMKIRKAMETAGADVYNQRSTSFYTGQMAWFAANLGRKFTFSIGIDYNCYPDCQGLLSFPMTALYRYGIRHANAVIAQTEKQRKLLGDNMGRDSVLIRNGIPILYGDEKELSRGSAALVPDGHEEKTRPDFLWVGSFRRRKRPELFLELARRVPEAAFTLVGGGGDDIRFHEEIVREASTIRNVAYKGSLTPSAIEYYYARAYGYVNTSTLEGFPNTYLHSWRHGVPTLTIDIDPDGIITDNRIGFRAGNFEELVERVRSLCASPSERREMSSLAIAYVRDNHDITARGDDYIKLFEGLIAGKSDS